MSKHYYCKICSKRFSRNNSRSRHEQAVHYKRSSLKCQVCKKSFSRMEHLNRHNCQQNTFAASDKKTFKCNVCWKVFTRNDSLRRHVRHVHAGERYFCDQCTASCTRKEDLIKHKESKHAHSSTSSVGTVSSVVCSICRQQFSKIANLNRHVVEAHEDMKNHICPRCPSGFSRKDIMERHLIEVHGKPKKVCIDCGKTFVRDAYLRRHIWDVHEKQKPFRCHMCPEKFARRENLIRHLTEGECTRVIDCEFCHKDIPLRSFAAYERHFVTDHLGKKTCVNERTFSITCTACCEEFTFKTKLEEKEFMANHTFPSPHRMDMTKRWISPENWKHRHYIVCMNTINNFMSYVCDFCDKLFQFQSSSEVLEHFEKHYAIKTCFQTTTCISKEERMKKGISALRFDPESRGSCTVPNQNLCSSHMECGGKRDKCIHTCVEKIMREELEYEDPMALENNPCHHLECARVITKIIHPISIEDGDMSLEELRMQLPKYSKRGREYECRWCPATFHEEERLNSHMHEGNHYIKFHCENCDQMLDFRSMKQLEKHLHVRKLNYGIIGGTVTCKSPLSRKWECTGGGGHEEIKKRLLTRGLAKGKEEMWKLFLKEERLQKMKNNFS